MSLIRIKTIVLGVCGILALAAALSLEVERREYPARFAGLVPLRIPLSQQDESKLRTSFTATWTEPHYVALVFPHNVGDLELESILERARSAVGSVRQEDGPQFDFDWRAFEGAIEVGRGSGRTRPTGSFGVRDRGLAFGEFPARAGHLYVIEMSRGPGFDRLLRTPPTLEVGVNSAMPSIGLAWGRQSDGAVVWCLGLLGVMLVGWAVVSYRKSVLNGRGHR
jgi:hypothetical protein